MAQSLFESYQQGLKALVEALGRDYPRLNEAHVYQQRLAENLESTTRYGDTKARKAERAEILAYCNQLSQETTGKPFADFCPGAETEPYPGESPYKGLLYFTEDDADNFFGRDAWTARLVERLRDMLSPPPSGAYYYPHVV